MVIPPRFDVVRFQAAERPRTVSPGGLPSPPRVQAGAGRAASGHDFYSMTYETAGKRAFPFRWKPRRHQ